jgi:hypothetical protein
MRIVRSSILISALLAAAALPARADCTYPKAPASMPDGNTATMEEMVAGQTQVKAYMADMDAYLKCLDEGVTPLAADATDDQKKEYAKLETIRVQKHNAAVADEEAVAERFNVQLKSFRARQAKKN